MYSVSADFLSTVRKAHTAVRMVQVISESTIETVDVAIAGTVTIDSTSPVRRRANLSLIDEKNEWIPKDSGDLLAPYGNYLRLWRGVQLSSGVEELVPLATVRISKVRAEDTGDGIQLSIDAYDRFRYISRNRFTVPYVIDSGVNYGTAIKNLLMDRDPSLTLDRLLFTGTTYSTPQQLIFEEQEDPIEKAIEMAGSCGMVLYMDGMDNVVMKPAPSTSDPSVFDFIEGTNCTLSELSKDWDDDGGYNGVIEESNQSDVTYHGEAWDDLPTSATYYLGRYGKYPFFHSSQYFSSDDQCTVAAKARFDTLEGITEANDMSFVPNTALDGGDVVTIDRDVMGYDMERHFLDTIVIPLEAESLMSAQTRRLHV